MDKDEKREFYKGLRERIKQLRMEHLFEEPCPLYEEEDDSYLCTLCRMDFEQSMDTRANVYCIGLCTHSRNVGRSQIRVGTLGTV